MFHQIEYSEHSGAIDFIEHTPYNKVTMGRWTFSTRDKERLLEPLVREAHTKPLLSLVLFADNHRNEFPYGIRSALGELYSNTGFERDLPRCVRVNETRNPREVIRLPNFPGEGCVGCIFHNRGTNSAQAFGSCKLGIGNTNNR